MYSYYEATLFPKGWSKNSPVPDKLVEPLQMFIYMSLHATGCLMSFCIALFAWSNFWFHTIYLLVLLTISIHNGATYYFRVMRKKILKQIKEDQEEEQKIKEGRREPSESEDNKAK